jgi:hypothetical protein
MTKIYGLRMQAIFDFIHIVFGASTSKITGVCPVWHCSIAPVQDSSKLDRSERERTKHGANSDQIPTSKEENVNTRPPDSYKGLGFAKDTHFIRFFIKLHLRRSRICLLLFSSFGGY